MDELTRLNKEEFEQIVSKYKFQMQLMAKDYYITVLLFLLKDVEGIYFKGGTAINKILLNHARLSEDIDYTLTRKIEDIKKEITVIIKNSKHFNGITKDKDVSLFTRLIVHYDTELGKGTIFINLNKRSKLLTKSESLKINHFYPNIPEFSMNCLSKEEMIAEKIKATIQRNKPRDHFDVYMLIKQGHNFNIELVKQKCKLANVEYDIIKMFNQAKKLNKRWNEDMIPLLSIDVSFEEVMKMLAKYFKLKNAKNEKK